MKPNEILIFLREKKGLSQRKLSEKLPISRSTYNRYEKEEQEINLIILLDILKTLDTTINDYIELLNINDEFKNYQKKMKTALDNQETELVKELVTYFLKNRQNNLTFFSYYISLYLHLRDNYKQLFISEEQLKEEIHLEFSKILDSEYHTTIDYKFTANALLFAPLNLKSQLINQLIFSPKIDSFASKGEAIQIAIAQLLNNYIDRLITHAHFQDIHVYLTKQQEILNHYPSQQYSTLLKFHESRVNYFFQPSSKNLANMYNIMDHYEFIGYKQDAQALNEDINSIINVQKTPHNTPHTDKPNILDGWN